MLTDLRLSVMAFPQRWDGANLTLRVLLLPGGDPLAPLGTKPGNPPFAGATLNLRANLISGLDALPAPDSPSTPFAFASPARPGVPALFTQLVQGLTVVSRPRKPIDPGMRIRKSLPPSYVQAFPFEQPSKDFITVGDFGCVLMDQPIETKIPPPPTSEIQWGEVISLALRQPELARRLGMLYEDTVPIAPALLGGGGWIYLDLDPAQANPHWNDNSDSIRSYAARLPALTAARQLFAAALFPVIKTGGGGSAYDEPQAEAQTYDDGYAKILHVNQPETADAASGELTKLTPATDAGIQVGWDDEQVAIWHNRQLDAARQIDAGTAVSVESPLGVLGYRIDVRVDGAGGWKPLNQVQAKLRFGAEEVTTSWEAVLEPTAVRANKDVKGDPWLPVYFAQWRGGSLAVSDGTINALTGGEPTPPPSVLQPQLPAGLHLSYGHGYSFRSRLADLTGGGPRVDDVPRAPAPAPVATCAFKRFVPPKATRVETDAAAHADRSITTISAWRPLLGYPEFAFAGVTDPSVVAKLIQRVKHTGGKEVVGVPDPDVSALHIIVEARVPAHDEDPSYEGAYRLVYELDRPFPALPTDLTQPGAPLVLNLAYQDMPDVTLATVAAIGPGLGPVDPLPVPRARDVRIRLIPFCADKPAYFGSDAARHGIAVNLATRREAEAEVAVFVPQPDTRALNAIFLQPDEGMTRRLAQHLGLAVEGLTFSGAPGRRTVFAASRALRHTLSGDHSSIEFSGRDQLLHHWLAVIRLTVQRDWTWDALDDRSFEVVRDGLAVGSLEVRQTVSAGALGNVSQGEAADRSHTDLVFFDAIDPNPPSGFPEPQSHTWTITPVVKGGAMVAPLTYAITLPIAVAPTQMPQLASAGIALSDYQAASDYSSTEVRRRSLWLEFAEPPANPHDGFFARVLAYGPDPLLTNTLLTAYNPAVPNPREPDLPVDLELIRVITPGQAADRGGLDAMVRLEASPGSPRHFLMPLPAGITSESLELFGFWTYELRAGHLHWATAQACFGRPLRVTGVQHPVPTLTCAPVRLPRTRKNPERIEVVAPFATTVLDGRRLTDPSRGDPTTEIWVLLYTQVVQADGSSRRNVLLAEAIAQAPAWNFNRADPPVLTRDLNGIAVFVVDEIQQILGRLALPPDSPLSVLAVELLRGGRFPGENYKFAGPAPGGTPLTVTFNSQGAAGRRGVNSPLGAELGSRRILRTSPLEPVPAECLVPGSGPAVVVMAGRRAMRSAAGRNPRS
jgi:hypothetical protein